VEAMPYFLKGTTDCAIRDDQTGDTGTAGCISPGGAQSSLTQCVNTIENDTVRSGKAIIETKPPTGVPGDSAWTQQLVKDFIINLSTGSAGQGSERGLGSVIQLL